MAQALRGTTSRLRATAMPSGDGHHDATRSATVVPAATGWGLPFTTTRPGGRSSGRRVCIRVARAAWTPAWHLAQEPARAGSATNRPGPKGAMHRAARRHRPWRPRPPRSAGPGGSPAGSGRWPGRARRRPPPAVVPRWARCRGSPDAVPRSTSPSDHLGEPRHDAMRVAQQLVDGAGGHGGVEAPFLDRGADHDGAVPARHDVDRGALHHARAPCGTTPGRAGSARRRRIWPLTGRTGGTAPRGSPSSWADQRPAASTTARGVRGSSPPSRRTPGTVPPGLEGRRTACPVDRRRRRPSPRRAAPRRAGGCRPGGRRGPRSRRARRARWSARGAGRGGRSATAPRGRGRVGTRRAPAPRPGRRRRPPRPASPWCGSRRGGPRPGQLGGEGRPAAAPTRGPGTSRDSSPWWTSLTGASIPAAAHDAPRPGRGRPRPPSCPGRPPARPRPGR